MSRTPTRRELRGAVGLAGVAGLSALVGAAYVLLSESTAEVTTGERLVLAGMLATLAVVAGAAAAYAARRAANAPEAAEPVDEATRQEARVRGLVLTSLQGGLMVLASAYGFSSDKPVVAYGGAVAACCYFGLTAWFTRSGKGRGTHAG